MITVGRMAGAIILLFIIPLSVPFFTVYFLCGVSDIADGYVARKINAASRFGEILDSVADFVFIAVMLTVFIPMLEWEPWMLWWAGMIALIRLSSLGIGFIKYRAFSFLHTYANKATGIVLFCFPLLYLFAGLPVTVCIICGIASLSAAEELLITICTKKLDRNVHSIFSWFSLSEN